MIRESMLDSHRYASLGDPAKLLFVHILLLADDFGCVSVSPTFLRRRAFYNSPTNEHIAKLLGELTDADLIRCYEADGAQLAFIPRFRQRLQRENLKHAQPPMALLQGDQQAIDKFNKINELSSKTTVAQQISTVGQPPEVEVEVEVEGCSSRGSNSIQTIKALSGKPDEKAGLKAQALEILGYLNANTKRNYRPVDSNVKLIVARLQSGATPLQCREVIFAKCQQWIDDPKMAEYLRPATLFNATKFEQYLGEQNAMS
jgi:uncharacterized phage protein (TIGR02220 family)